MSEPEIRISSNLEELSRAAFRLFSERASRALDANGSFFAALSGGSTPRRLYELMASPEIPLPWEKMHFFQVDERCVPPDSTESNYRMVREVFLSRSSFPESNFHRMKAELSDREAAAEAYSQELTRALHVARGEWPRLDLVTLGMGADGHTASLFPGSPALNERGRSVVPNFSSRLNSYRLTLTLPVLNAAAEIVFLVSGAGKAETLRSVLKSQDGDRSLPASMVRPASGHVTWFVDSAVAIRSG